jgi:twitching motility protein PilJ
MADLAANPFSKNSVKGKLLRDFTLAISGSVLAVGIFLIIAIYILNRNQVEKATYEIEKQGQERLSEQSKVLGDILNSNMVQIDDQLAADVSSDGILASKLARMQQAPTASQFRRYRRSLNSAALESMVQQKLSFLTILNTEGIVITRATDPSLYGDEVYISDYSKAQKPVSSIIKSITGALQGKSKTGLVVFPKEILATEKVNFANAISGVTVADKNTLADQARIPTTKEKQAEDRGLVMCSFKPILSEDNLEVIGVVIAGKLLNRNPKALLTDFHKVIPNSITKPSFTIEDVRILSSETLPNGNSSIGYVIPNTVWDAVREDGRSYLKRASTGVLDKAYAQFVSIKDIDGKTIGSQVLATDYNYYAGIIADQEQTSTSIILSTVGIVLVVLIIGVSGGFFFAKARADLITQSINEIKSLMNSVLSGDFNARSNITSGDEFEELSVLFNEMIRRLSALIETETERDAMQKQLTDLLIVVSNSADGDFTQRAVVTEGALGALADSFNLMVDDLGTLIREVQSAALQVGDAGTEILSSTEQMAHGAEEQSVQVANASAAVEEMAASIRQVAMNADSAAEAAQRATQVAQTGGKTVEETIEGMRRIHSSVQDSAQKIKSLGESSLEISKIVQTIEDIANQTNLLALNATIEAARAGEAGRGFAVVADQVRELAERSSKATNDISQLVQTIQSETQDSVSAMERGTIEVERGTKLADSASRALEEIRNVVTQSTELIQEISLAAKQQDIASSGVVSAMTEVSQIAKQSLLGAKQSASLATRLNSITEQLAKSVSRFKIPAGMFHSDKPAGDPADGPVLIQESYDPQGNVAPLDDQPDPTSPVQDSVAEEDMLFTQEDFDKNPEAALSNMDFESENFDPEKIFINNPNEGENLPDIDFGETDPKQS